MPQVLFADDPDMRVGCAWAEEMLARGVYVHPWHNMFMCAAMTEVDVDRAVAAADESFAAVRSRLGSLEPHPIVAHIMAGH